jgi:hypothetical protein
MRFPWVNAVLLILVVLQVTTGFFGFTNGFLENRGLLWLHGIGGFGIAGVLFWKAKLILAAYRRSLGYDVQRLGFLALTVGLLATMASGYVWTYLGPKTLGGLSLVTVHIFLAVSILLLFVWHLWAMRFILRHPEIRNRDLVLRSGGFLMAGLALWRLGDLARVKFSLPGAKRRFTGSYRTGGPGRFPAYIWLSDKPEQVPREEWRLMVTGEVAHPLHLTYRDLEGFPLVEWEATLDCTGGWYTSQTWRGIRVSDFLNRIQVKGNGKSVSFESVTGYKRRFAIQEANNFLLAVGVGGLTLDHGHGFPLRLVAPGRRGYHWVKWVTAVHINPSGPFWQPPLPLQ